MAMAYRELGVTTIVEVLRRWLRGQGRRGVARATGVDRKAVTRYIEAAVKCGLQPGEPEASLTPEVLGAVTQLVQVGAKVQTGSGFATCVEHRDRLLAWHADGAAGPKLVELLQRHTAKTVALRTLQRFMHAELAKGKGADRTCHVADCSPGQELQVDYEQLGLVEDAQTQTRRILHAFVCTAVYSRHTFVYPCWQETTETTIQALEAAWEFFGGVFAGIIPDNLKAVVVKPDPVNPVFNEVFLEYSQSRGFLIGPARIRKPKDKGRVENTNKYTQSSFFAGEELSHIEQWRQAAVTWCLDKAGLRTHGTTGKQPLVQFEQEERPALLPKPTTPWDMPRWTTAKVGRDGRIRVENAWYVVTKDLSPGDEVTVRVDRTTVRVLHKHKPVHVFGRVEARQTGGLQPSATSLQDSIASRSREQLEAQATEQGTQVGEVARRLLGRGLWFSQVRKVLHLLKLCDKYGKQAVQAACAKLLAVDDDDPVRVERVVKLGLEAQGQTAAMPASAVAGPGMYARDNQTWKMAGIGQGEQDAAGT